MGAIEITDPAAIKRQSREKTPASLRNQAIATPIDVDAAKCDFGYVNLDCVVTISIVHLFLQEA
jgi:hypothetical protein